MPLCAVIWLFGTMEAYLGEQFEVKLPRTAYKETKKRKGKGREGNQVSSWVKQTIIMRAMSLA